MISKLNLEEAMQVGPWRIKRKHLLFTIIFGIAVIVFGIIVLETHVFDKDTYYEDGNDDDDDEDDDDEDYGSPDNPFIHFNGGDWIMIFLMVAAGLIALVAAMVCILAKPNTPRRMSTSRQASIYSVQYNSKDVANKTPQTNGTRQSFSAPQQLPVWTGQPAAPVAPVPQQQFIPRVTPTQQPNSQTSVHKIVLENKPTAPASSGGKEYPPPYSP